MDLKFKNYNVSHKYYQFQDPYLFDVKIGKQRKSNVRKKKRKIRYQSIGLDDPFGDVLQCESERVFKYGDDREDKISNPKNMALLNQLKNIHSEFVKAK